MATIANLLIGLGVDFGGVSKGLSRGAKVLRSGISNLRSSFTGMQGILDKMQSSASRIGSALSGAIQGAARSGVSLAAAAEQAQISFKVLIGDAEKAAQLSQGIREFAASTPFESVELIDASKQLLAFGTSAEQVVPTLRMLGDLSAGMGIPLGELAELYGKARVQQTLFAEDINQLTGRGINVVSVWAEEFGVTTAEIKKMASEGQIGFADLQRALMKLTGEGGAFGGMMERQSATLSGLWSTAIDNAKTAATGFGAALLEWLDAKDALAGLNSVFGAMLDALQGMRGATEDNSKSAAQWAESWINGAEFVVRGLAHVADFFKFLGDLGSGVVAGFKFSVGGLLDVVALMLEGLEAAMRKLPAALGGSATADLGSQSMRASAAAWAAEGQQAWDDMIAGMSERTNAEAVTQFFDQVRQSLQQTAAESVQTAEAVEVVQQALAGAGGKGSLTAMESRLSLGKQLTAQPGRADDSIEAATRGSTEAFSAIRQFRGQGRNDPLRQLEKLNEAAAREQELQRENNRLIREALNNLQAAEVLN